MALSADLERIEELINGLNYVTMLEVHNVAHDSLAAHHFIVQQCIPDSDPIGFTPVDADGLIGGFSRCVVYSGHPGHGPDNGTFDRPEFTDSFSSAKASIRELCEATKPLRFSFRFGRPYSPIYRDFSFLFRGHKNSSVLVGAAWD